jgi:hypothetical protein
MDELSGKIHFVLAGAVHSGRDGAKRGLHLTDYRAVVH